MIAFHSILPSLVLCNFFCLPLTCSAQNTFQYTIGGEGNDRAYDLISLPDGYALTGFSSSQGSGSEDAYLMKLNDSYNLEWSKVIGSPNNDRGHKVIPSKNGGFLITGQTYPHGNNNPSDMLIAKTDDSGELTWISSNGGHQNENGWGLVELPDNNLIYAGLSRSYAVSGNGAYLFKTNPTGSPIWGTIFDNTSSMAPPASDYFRDIVLCFTGNYVYMTGTVKRPGTCPLDNNRSNWYTLIAKVDLNGQLMWHTYVGGNNCREIGLGLTQTSDGHIVATGYTENFGAGGRDVYAAKVDGDNGQLMWTHTYGGPGDEIAYTVEETADGGLIFTGCTDSYGAGSTDVLLLKTDGQGFLEWSRTYGGPGNEEGFAVIQTDDLGYLFVGFTTSYGNGGEDIFIVKTDEEGRIDHCEYGSPALAEGIGGSTHTGLRTSTGFDVASVSARNDPGNDLINEVECCPSADFEIVEICPEAPIQFTDLSDGDILSWQWNFGDGSESNDTNPIHLYSDPGNYTVSLIVTNNLDCADTATMDIDTPEKVELSIGGDSIICAGQSATLAAHPGGHAYLWNTGESNQMITVGPAEDTEFSVWQAVTGTCIPDTAFFHVEVIDSIAPWVTGDTLLCSGQNTQLTAHPDNAKYLWSTGESTQSIIFSPQNDTSLFVIVNDSTRCILDTVFIQMEVMEELSAGITGDTLLCRGQTSQLTAQPANAQYQWSTGEITQSILISPENDTSLNVIVNDSSRCNSDTVFIAIEVIEPINPGFKGDTLLCSGQTTQLTAQPAHANFQWSTGETTQSILLSPPNDTSLFFIVSEGTPCNYDTVFISLEVIDLITPRISGDTLLCSGQSTRLTAHPQNAEFLWSNREITRSVELSPETDTSLFVIVSDSMQCSIDTIHINVYILLDDFAEIRGNMLLCQGEETQLTAHPSRLNYEWSTGDTANTITLSPNADSSIWLKIIQGECSDSTEVNINVWEYADLNITPGDTVICPGDELFLTVMSSNCTEFHWTPDSGIDCISCANPLVYPEGPTTYFVSCENDSLCLSMDSVTVFTETNVEEVCYHCETTNVYIPNSFSPNDDGINDVFYIVGPGIESILSFQVFSRWGEKVFGIANTPANEQAFGWDGTYKNLKAEPGVYLYRVEIRCEKMGTKVKEGSIQLFR